MVDEGTVAPAVDDAIAAEGTETDKGGAEKPAVDTKSQVRFNPPDEDAADVETEPSSRVVKISAEALDDDAVGEVAPECCGPMLDNRFTPLIFFLV